MEEQVESTGSVATVAAPVTAALAALPKGPLKTEEISQSSPDNEAHERSDGVTSPPPNCSICLGKLVNKSFTDSCLHQFCFSCLLQWSKIKTECPLCKQTFKSIIHNVRSEKDYDQYHVPRQFVPLPAPQMAATLDVNFGLAGNLDIGGLRLRYRTSLGPNRQYGVLLNPDQVARHEQIPAITSLVSRDERRMRRINPTDYRRNVYRFGSWATSLPDIFGNFRECSADYYRREPNQLNRLIPWLNRELQVLLDNNSHVAYVLRVIMESLTRFDLRSPEFRELVRPYFGIHTEHFVHELLNYARTNFDMIGYDQYVTYISGHGYSHEHVPFVTSPSSSSSSTSNDSDVQVVDETIDRSRLNTVLPRVGPHTVEMPGPSTVAEAFREQLPLSGIVLTISSSSSGVSDNECEVVGYVKPRHERTPEIIDLLSSDAEMPNITNAAPLDYADPTRNSYQPATRQYATYEDSIDRSLLDSPNVPNLGEVHEPGTSTERKRILARNNTKMVIKGRFSDTTSSESDAFDSDRNYNPRSSGKSKNKSKRSTAVSISQRKHKQGTSRFTRIRRRVKVMVSSSSESDDRSKQRGYKQTSVSPESEKRRCSSSWSDSSPERRSKRQRFDGNSKSMQSDASTTIKVRKDLIKREGWYNQGCPESDVSQVSASVSEHRSFPSKKCELKRYRTYRDSDSEKETEKHESNDDGSPSKQHMDKFKSECSTSDSERTLSNVRSSSQCSMRSSRAHVSKKKSKHKDKRREKRICRSNSKLIVDTGIDSFQADNCTPSVSTSASVISSSVRSETLPTSKYSNSKKRSSSKERRRPHKKYKESKKSRKRSKSESKSRSKKKKCRIRSSSSSDSERNTVSKLC